MLTLLYIVFSGFLSRAKGWGAEADAPKWQKKLAAFLSIWTCGGLFALATLLLTLDALTALAAGVAFIVWRNPGFHGWEKWGAMFWRGLWPSAIGFTLLSYVTHGHGWLGLLSLPFSVIYMTIYAGGYKWLPETILGFKRHVWIELASGSAFGAFILAVIYG
jgi:hypothetical protein